MSNFDQWNVSVYLCAMSETSFIRDWASGSVMSNTHSGCLEYRFMILDHLDPVGDYIECHDKIGRIRITQATLLGHGFLLFMNLNVLNSLNQWYFSLCKSCQVDILTNTVKILGQFQLQNLAFSFFPKNFWSVPKLSASWHSSFFSLRCLFYRELIFQTKTKSRVFY